MEEGEEHAAWSPTPLPSLRSSPELITSSISCTPREPSSIGMSVRVWKKVSSLRPERISPPSIRITRRSVLRPPRVRAKRKAWIDHTLSSTHQHYSFNLEKIIKFSNLKTYIHQMLFSLS